MIRRPFAASLSVSLMLVASGALAQTPVKEEPPLPPKPPVQALSAAEEAKTFQLPPGYRMELVLSEPEIKEPVIASFDGDGRMFVAEMRTYMQDIDGNHELEANSLVSLHWSSKKDGVFDKHTVFADKLLLPRILLPLDKGRVIIGETNTLDLYLYTDTDGDGVADKKELWFQGGARGGNLEHQPNGLVWAIDNGLYSTYNAYRLRWTPGGAVREPAAANNGQWGLAQDNYGRIFYMNAGGESGPQSYQTPVVYGAFNPPAAMEKGFPEVFPAVGRGDFQGGLSRVRKEDDTLNHFTATAGAEVYRGDRLPAELKNNLFFGEPVGRLVRRALVENKEGLTVLSNPYQAERSEFLRSTDLLFRPLNFSTGPDGTLYIVDMYRGIIQEGNWVARGSYLRRVVEQYSFQNVIGRGRIWRLVHETTKPGPQPAMNEESAAQLVAHLEHPNGWWRDTAQKLLILKQDRSVVPALAAMAQKSENPLARIHALWTLEGLEAAEPALLQEKYKDKDPQVRIAAIRVTESLVKKGDKSLQPAVEALVADSDPQVALQVGLTAQLLKWPSAPVLLAKLTESPAAGPHTIATAILHPPLPASSAVKFTAAEQKSFDAGKEIFQTLCAACHGPDGKGMPMVGGLPGMRLAPALAGSKTVNGAREGAVLVLLHGLTGEIDGKKYEGQMIPMATNDDAWIANVVSFVRNSFGNKGGFLTPDDVKRLRATTAARTQPWTDGELRASLPQPLPGRKTWKLTASHNAGKAGLAVDGDLGTRYDTGVSQTPGMWFQIELPLETEIAGLDLDSVKSVSDYPRGYTVQLSSDGQTWSKPVATGVGREGITSIQFPAAKAKFIRITQTGAVDGLFWSIHELEIFAPSKTQLVSTRS